MKKQKGAQASHAKAASKGKALLFSSMIGVVTGIISFVLLLFAFGSICMLINNPHKILLPLGLAAVYLSSVLAGCIAVKRNKDTDILLCSALCGVIYTLFLWLCLSVVRIIFNLDASFSFISFILNLSVIAASVAGGFLSGLIRPGKPKRKF